LSELGLPLCSLSIELFLGHALRDRDLEQGIQAARCSQCCACYCGKGAVLSKGSRCLFCSRFRGKLEGFRCPCETKLTTLFYRGCEVLKNGFCRTTLDTCS
jgi:hypothetical protein